MRAGDGCYTCMDIFLCSLFLRGVEPIELTGSIPSEIGLMTGLTSLALGKLMD